MHGSFSCLAGLETSHTCMSLLGSGFFMLGPFKFVHYCLAIVAWEFFFAVLCFYLLFQVSFGYRLSFFLLVLGAVYFCLFQSPFMIMIMFAFARLLHPLAAVLGTCLLLKDILYFTLTNLGKYYRDIDEHRNPE